MLTLTGTYITLYIVKFTMLCLPAPRCTMSDAFCESCLDAKLDPGCRQAR